MPNVGDWLGPERFETIIGVIFLVIVLASPGGLVGIWESVWARRNRAMRGPMEGSGTAAEVVDEVVEPHAV
jgi:hypothetical protein